MANFWEVGLGAVGDAVETVQKALNNIGASLDVDGIFGEKTKAAVQDYQKKFNLAVDGIVGNETWGSLVNNLTGKSTKTNSANVPATQPAAPAPATTPINNPSNTDWSYDSFKASSDTAAADQKRQNLESQKPGEFSHKAYEESDVVKQAQAMLQQQIANKPGIYQSQWQNQLNETMDKILNREKFSYDINGDALYQQYKDQYTNLGQQAMMDTMGQAQAMTGGYGNSYAQTAGQQVYQGHLQQLNDKVPELYQIALNRYNQEGQDLYNQYGMYADRENQDYSRYRDTVSDYNTELERLTNDARYQSETDYNRYLDSYNRAYGEHRDAMSDWQQALNRADEDYWNQYNRDYSQYVDDRNLAYDNYWNEKNMSYQQGRDAVADSQWQKQFDEAQRQYDQNFGYQQERDAIADQQWNQSFEYQQDRDAVADRQWDQSFQYQQDRDAIADQQWNQSFNYQKGRDAIADQQWNQSFQYQQGRDKVADQQWNQSFQYQQSRDKVSDSQWQKEFDEALRQFNFTNKLGEFAPVVAVGGGGGSSGGGSGSGGSGGSGGGSGGSGGGSGGSGGGKTALDAAINALVKGDDGNGTVYSTSTANRGTVSGQNQIKSAVNAAINAAVKDGTITAKEAAEKKRAQRGYTY